MNLKHYNKLLEQPQGLTQEDLAPLDVVVQEFPFFQSAQALRLKILKQNESLGYNLALKKTAAVTTDRDVLFDYITSAEFSQQTISDTLVGHQDHVKQINVTLENQEISAKDTLESKSEHPALSEQPFDFDKSERHSFEQWLKLTAAKPIDRTNESIQSEENSHTDPENAEAKWEKIDRFLAQKPNLKPQRTTNQHNLAENYLETSDQLMTETLARVYVQQKNYQKAIQAYKILILKYPEKSSFFADQIQELNRLLNA